MSTIFNSDYLICLSSSLFLLDMISTGHVYYSPFVYTCLFLIINAQKGMQCRENSNHSSSNIQSSLKIRIRMKCDRMFARAMCGRVCVCHSKRSMFRVLGIYNFDRNSNLYGYLFAHENLRKLLPKVCYFSKTAAIFCAYLAAQFAQQQ